MADDPWANWQPRANPSAIGQQAFKARQALSRGGSVDPAPVASSSAASTAAAAAAVAARTTAQARNDASTARERLGTGSGRAPLPDPPSFPNRGPSGRRERDRSPARLHADRGWGSKNVETAKESSRQSESGIGKSSLPKSPRDRNDWPPQRWPQKENDERERDDAKKSRDRTTRRSRSRSRERSQEADSYKRPRRDNDNDQSRRRRERSRSPQKERHSRREDGSHRSRREDYDNRRQRDLTVDADGRQNASRETATRRTSAKPLNATGSGDPTRIRKALTPPRDTENRTILLEGLLEGTTSTDVKTILEEYGKIQDVVSGVKDAKAKTVGFEATFARGHEAVAAIRALDGILADGCRIRARCKLGQSLSATSTVVQDTATTKTTEPAKVAIPAPAVKSPTAPPVQVDLRLKGFASNGDQGNSLLSRLGDPPAKKASTNGSATERSTSANNMPYELLAPYGDLLQRAGIDSVSKLRLLVRPGTIKEYIEMLCTEYPDEPLLKGLTARWALKERLEEWLDLKKPSGKNWEEENVQDPARERTLMNGTDVTMQDEGIDLV